LRSARFQGYDVEIIYKDGVATLGGTVMSADQRNAATAIVSQVAGVQRVDNQMVISGLTQGAPQAAPRSAPPVMQAPANTSASQNQQMANSIGQALKSANFKGYDIEIFYKDGVAVLGGSVASADQKAAASGIVQRVAGVQQVDNRLVVAEQPPMARPINMQ